MKNGDTKKLLPDVKNVFTQENLINRILFIVLFCSASFLGQIPINNFAHSEIITTYSGFTKFTILDLNKDGIDDVFLYGNNRKSFIIHKGLKDSTFSKALKIFFLFPIDDFKHFVTTKTGEDYFIFVSRNKRVVGLASFTKKNTLQLLHKIELDSYPTAIKIVDLNNDEIPEALIYGNNFNGLALVKNNGFRLKLTKIIDDKIFTDILLCDFNQDDFEETILVDMLNNSLNFYESNYENEFQNVREIEFDETIIKTKILNYNNDDFFDIAVVKESGIEILLGDSVYSFSETFDLNYNFTIDDFEYCDLNLDGMNDFILFDDANDKIIFDYNEIGDEGNMVFSYSGLTDYKVLQNGNEKKIITLSKEGKLNIVTNITKWESSFSFYLGGKLARIKSLTNDSSKSIGFAIYDEENKIVNILHLDSLGNFNNIIKVPFTNSISDFIITSNPNFIVGYSNEDRLLEKISITENGKKMLKYFVYADYPISYAKVDSNFNIIAVELDNGKLYSQIFIKTEDSYLAEPSMFIDSSVVSAKLDADNKPIYWKQLDNSFSLNSISLKGAKNNLLKTNSTKIFPFFINSQSSIHQQTVTYVTNSTNEFFYFPFSVSLKEVEIKEELFSSMSIENDLFFSKDTNGNINSLYYNDKNLERIIELKYNLKKNMFEQSKIIKTNKVDDFIVEEIFEKTYLIYSNSNNENISFKIISEK